MDMFNKYRNKYRKKIKRLVSLDSTELKTIRNGINAYTKIINKNDKVLHKAELAKHPLNNLRKYIPLSGR